MINEINNLIQSDVSWWRELAGTCSKLKTKLFCRIDIYLYLLHLRWCIGNSANTVKSLSFHFLIRWRTQPVNCARSTGQPTLTTATSTTSITLRSNKFKTFNINLIPILSIIIIIKIISHSIIILALKPHHHHQNQQQQPHRHPHFICSIIGHKIQMNSWKP